MNPLERYRENIPDYDAFWDALQRPLPVAARINTLKTTVVRVMARLAQADVVYRPLAWYPWGIRLDLEKPGRLMEHHMGHIHLQEEVSMLPVTVLDPRPGETVLDLCAAPGSKTSQIAQHMQNKGLLVANESSGNRIVPLRSNLERLGVLNVAVTSYDGRRFPDHSFDRVLVDVPCTSEGTVRRTASVLGRSGQRASLALQRLQSGLLQRALALTRSGGIVVYSTCTYAPEENEGVVSSVLDQADLVDFRLPGFESSPGLTGFEGFDFGSELTRCARYYPHQNDTGGFFVAKLVKR